MTEAYEEIRKNSIKKSLEEWKEIQNFMQSIKNYLLGEKSTEQEYGALAIKTMLCFILHKEGFSYWIEILSRDIQRKIDEFKNRTLN